jgi:hypothetical protein
MCYFGAYVSLYPALLSTLHTLPGRFALQNPSFIVFLLSILVPYRVSLSSIGPSNVMQSEFITE